MVKKVRFKFHPFLVGLVLVMCVSVLAANVFAVDTQAMVNGGFESAFNNDGTDWEVPMSVDYYNDYRSTTYYHSGSYSFYTGYDTLVDYGLPLNMWQSVHMDSVNPHDITSISVEVLGSTGQLNNSNVIQVMTVGGWINIADLSNNTSGYSAWTTVTVAGGHGSALDIATGGSNITVVAMILYTGDTFHPERSIAVDDFSVLISDTAGETPVVTPDTPVTSAGDAWASAINMVAPFIVMAIPAFIFAVYLKMGVWGFLLGIDIGVALAYGFLPVAMKPDVWLIFLVGLVNFGMVWKGRG